ncbi:uracil-DNA glycosylase, partial [Paraburkholderia sp. SIMBA_049]
MRRNGVSATLSQPLADTSDASHASDTWEASHAWANKDAASALDATTAIPRELLSWLKAAACFRAPD